MLTRILTASVLFFSIASGASAETLGFEAQALRFCASFPTCVEKLTNQQLSVPELVACYTSLRMEQDGVAHMAGIEQKYLELNKKCNGALNRVTSR